MIQKRRTLRNTFKLRPLDKLILDLLLTLAIFQHERVIHNLQHLVLHGKLLKRGDPDERRRLPAPLGHALLDTGLLHSALGPVHLVEYHNYPRIRVDAENEVPPLVQPLCGLLVIGSTDDRHKEAPFHTIGHHLAIPLGTGHLPEGETQAVSTAAPVHGPWPKLLLVAFNPDGWLLGTVECPGAELLDDGGLSYSGIS